MTRRCLTADIIDMGHLEQFSPSSFPIFPRTGVIFRYSFFFLPSCSWRVPSYVHAILLSQDSPGCGLLLRHASGALKMASCGQKICANHLRLLFAGALRTARAIQFKFNSRRAKYTKIEQRIPLRSDLEKIKNKKKCCTNIGCCPVIKSAFCCAS